MSLLDLMGLVLVCAKALMLVVGVCFFLSGIDDLIVDFIYVLRSLYRRWFILPGHEPLTPEKLRDRPEQPVAVMIPAWDESAVIRPMLLNTLRSIEYRNYTIFVGTYLNDADTQREVDLVVAQDTRVKKIVTPHDGPTNKADCLNWIYSGIRQHELATGTQFQIFVMQDCEDVIQPMCYKVFNYLIPRRDMIQLPVESLPTPWYQMTGGHYIDEFAQSHYKDMLVREAIGASLPAAGVGAAFSRRAVVHLASTHSNELFSTESLTEDYEFGFRLHQAGFSQAFVRVMVPKSGLRRHWLTRKPVPSVWRETVCVREYFPDQFKFSVRQKSRWVVGIAMQGWANLGWQGNAATRYMLLRDRRATVTNLMNLLGYLLVMLVGGLWLVHALLPDSYEFPPLMEKHTFLWDVMVANVGMFVVRIVMRAYCTGRLYGGEQALLSFPRMIWGNFINFLATGRAIRLYIAYLKTGRFIKWDKTAHRYPNQEELAPAAPPRRLGELLLADRHISQEQLEAALTQQQRTPNRLGEILKGMGYVRPEVIDSILSRQAC
jgi:adsorption protein B